MNQALPKSPKCWESGAGGFVVVKVLSVYSLYITFWYWPPILPCSVPKNMSDALWGEGVESREEGYKAQDAVSEGGREGLEVIGLDEDGACHFLLQQKWAEEMAGQSEGFHCVRTGNNNKDTITTESLLHSRRCLLWTPQNCLTTGMMASHSTSPVQRT